jgi:hypothetical protein
LSTDAYCLLRNHFHVLVRIKTPEEQDEYHKTRHLKTLRGPDEASARNPKVSTPLGPKNPSQQFGNLLNAYAKATNKAYQGTGSLFQRPFTESKAKVAESLLL